MPHLPQTRCRSHAVDSVGQEFLAAITTPAMHHGCNVLHPRVVEFAFSKSSPICIILLPDTLGYAFWHVVVCRISDISACRSPVNASDQNLLPSLVPGIQTLPPPLHPHRWLLLQFRLRLRKFPAHSVWEHVTLKSGSYIRPRCPFQGARGSSRGR